MSHPVPSAAEFDQRDDFGHVVGVVHVVEYFPIERVRDVAAWRGFAPDDVSIEGPWCWVLERPRMIPPYPARGRTHLFDVCLR
ncbi:MAG: hypothetical protein KJ749_05725 [Planctomycetes bacterium]|nr:hypothetical protein [Planctomycetota bacterium]